MNLRIGLSVLRVGEICMYMLRVSKKIINSSKKCMPIFIHHNVFLGR